MELLDNSESELGKTPSKLLSEYMHVGNTKHILSSEDEKVIKKWKCDEAVSREEGNIPNFDLITTKCKQAN